MSEERLERIDKEVAGLNTRLDRMDRRLDERFDELGRHMRVLHEEALSAIAATREYSGPTKVEFAELKEMLGRRLDPLEATVRYHSTEIDTLKKARA